MKLETINKQRYRKHLNIILFGCAISLMVGALVVSTILIALFAQEFQSNFYLNLIGVSCAGLAVTTLLIKFKHHPWMTEVYYVWLLKQQLNLINRKLAKIEKAANESNADAFLILSFYYQGSQQLYKLDDNTITLSSLNKKSAILEQQISDAKVEIDVEQFTASLVKNFK